MSTPDLINGAFELVGGLFILNHCRVLYKDKRVKGVSIVSTAFFSAWGLWNLFFYPHLGQWLSFLGGLLIVAANWLWVGLMIYYTTRPARMLKRLFGGADFAAPGSESLTVTTFACRRCRAVVVNGKCQCETGPSPWEPVYGSIDMIPMPPAFNFRNGSHERCDMAQGPCSCGATHTLKDWPKYVQVAAKYSTCAECDRAPCRCSERSQ